MFDLVTFCFALHELEVERAIKEAGRVLKKGGTIATCRSKSSRSRLPEDSAECISFCNLWSGICGKPVEKMEKSQKY
uniref:Methyltransferase domain-containing protein n=1 Tax=Archaeoglobus fulgidus TaxID=2234 RepID=A0A7C2SER1_ARCFL